VKAVTPTAKPQAYSSSSVAVLAALQTAATLAAITLSSSHDSDWDHQQWLGDAARSATQITMLKKL
jgi:hypothetical protein